MLIESDVLDQIYDLVADMSPIDQMDRTDLESLQARLADMPDPNLDELWEMVLLKTGSLH
jgi:hypothetical protein